MIPMDHLQQWALIAPWPDSAQIEQDLIISRALCDLFNEPRLAGKIAFRGGTASTSCCFQNHCDIQKTSTWFKCEPGRLALSSMVFVLRSIG